MFIKYSDGKIDNIYKDKDEAEEEIKKDIKEEEEEKKEED